MKLRARITLSVSLCFGLIAGGLALEGRIREWRAEQRYQRELLAGYRTTWHGIADAELQRLASAIPAISRNDGALRALARRDAEGFAASLAEFLLSLQANPLPVEFEIATLDGELFFSSADQPLYPTAPLPTDHGQPPDRDAAPSSAAPRFLAAPLIEAVLRASKPLSGLIALPDGGRGLTVAFPLLTRTGPTAVGGFLLDAADLLPAFQASVGVPAFLLRADGTGARGADLALWRRSTDAAPPGRPAGARTVHRDRRTFTVVWLPLRDLFDREAAILATVDDITHQFWRDLLANALSHGAIGVALALFLGGLHWYLRHAFRPLNDVIGILNGLARGDTRLPVLATAPSRADEIGRLASAAEQFRQAQQARVQLTALRQELHIATRIQRALLPERFPERGEFDLCAELHTVGEVGGDFYDFFDLPDGRLGLVIADVSDKGIAAALFMAIARTVIRAVAQIVPEPGACLEQANALLSKDNAAAMFVTTFYGALDLATGELRYANAGHNPPYHIAPGKVAALARTGGMALGAIEELAFAERSLLLHPAESLLLYTDGVTEALDLRGAQFGAARLEAVLAAAPTDPRQMIAAVVGAVRTFAGSAPPADDLTLLALTYRGPVATEPPSARPAERQRNPRSPPSLVERDSLLG
jgi:sigma-B regulation protein RsbU (phosphoserine phosphatase)